MNVNPHPELALEPSQKSVKRPLQDITDRFPPISQSINRLSTTRPRRRGKALGSTSGAKFRTDKLPTLPSSLPPSSPPSTSSGCPLPEPDSHSGSPSLSGANLASQFESQTFEPEVAFEETNELDFLDNSDPFGFFAVEKKLKTLRAQQGNVQPRYRALPPPQIDTTSVVEHQQLVNPPTPRKRHNKRRAIASPNVSSPETFSLMPSTPSPSKPVSGKGKGRAVLQDEGNMNDETGGVSLETTSITLTVAIRRKPVKRACKESAEEAGISDPPDRKRSLRRAAIAAKTPKTGNARNATDEGESKPRKRGVAMQTKSKVLRQRTRTTGKVKPTGAFDDDQQERWERERQERLDYFKKLQDYQIEKENVYVV